uniref:Selenoprotein F n=1 Tax=Canis lupus familiaris TaxID=9615 RepID=A0A8C0MZM3_CANLF
RRGPPGSRRPTAERSDGAWTRRAARTGAAAAAAAGCGPSSVFYFSLFYFQVSTFGAEFSSEACRELGFSSNLLCSSCDLLGQFNLLQLDPDCRRCCQEEAQFETKKVSFSSISLPLVGVVEIR